MKRIPMLWKEEEERGGGKRRKGKKDPPPPPPLFVPAVLERPELFLLSLYGGLCLLGSPMKLHFWGAASKNFFFFKMRCIKGIFFKKMGCIKNKILVFYMQKNKKNKKIMQ